MQLPLKQRKPMMLAIEDTFRQVQAARLDYNPDTITPVLLENYVKWLRSA